MRGLYGRYDASSYGGWMYEQQQQGAPGHNTHHHHTPPPPPPSSAPSSSSQQQHQQQQQQQQPQAAVGQHYERFDSHGGYPDWGDGSGGVVGGATGSGHHPPPPASPPAHPPNTNNAAAVASSSSHHAARQPVIYRAPVVSTAAEGNLRRRSPVRENNTNTHSALNDMCEHPAKIFVGGLGQRTTDASLRAHFSAYGPVEDAAVVLDKSNGRSRGFGFCTFRDTTAVERCLRDRHRIDGVMCEVRRAVPRDQTNAQPPGAEVDARLRSCKCFVGGLSESVSENDLVAYFAQYGTVRDATLMYDRQSHRPRGFGFVIFDSSTDVSRVLGVHRALGEDCEVKLAEPRPPPAIAGTRRRRSPRMRGGSLAASTTTAAAAAAAADDNNNPPATPPMNNMVHNNSNNRDPYVDDVVESSSRAQQAIGRNSRRSTPTTNSSFTKLGPWSSAAAEDGDPLMMSMRANNNNNRAATSPTWATYTNMPPPADPYGLAAVSPSTTASSPVAPRLLTPATYRASPYDTRYYEYGTGGNEPPPPPIQHPPAASTTDRCTPGGSRPSSANYF